MEGVGEGIFLGDLGFLFNFVGMSADLITPMVRVAMRHRVRAAQNWDIERVQTEQWRWLQKNAVKCLYGLEHGVAEPRTYDEWLLRVPVAPYPDIRQLVMRMVEGERDILWPGRCRRFAQSSGTSDGRSKYIPVTETSLRVNHYRGASDAVAHYLHLYRDSRMFSGKGFILGGSFANGLDVPRGVKVGDLSANLIDAVNPLVNMVRIPGKEIALMEDWRQKVPALVAASLRANVTNISGVPSWFMTVLKEVIAAAGAENIHEVWPNLEVFFHGGIAMDPYREQYAALTDAARMRYVETYNASEGFFAVQDLREPGAMQLLLDAGVFYEFVPLDEVDNPHPRALAAWQVEEGRTYALVITAPNGLWRYPIGDTVRIVSANPLRIAIAGRTKHFINAFGEEVMVHNTDAALTAACRVHNCAVADYTVGPVYADGGHRGHHQWLVEWTTAPTDVAAFAATLDDALRAENSDYDAKRTGNIFLDPLTITALPRGSFDCWLASTGKLGGQRKVPRLSNNRSVADALLAMCGV